MLCDGIKFTPAADPTRVEPKPAAAKKRARKPAAPAVGAGVTVLGDRFVCSYSAQIREHAIFIPGVPTVCFANIPCAFAWLRDNVRDAATLTDLKTKVCEAYEQPSIDGVLTPPDRSYLSDFGGDRLYPEWIGELAFWDIQASVKGSTVAQWKKQEKKSGTSKRGKGADKRLTLDTGMYSVGVGGMAATKKVDTIDGAEDATGLTAIKATRKLAKFVASHPDLACLTHTITLAGGCVITYLALSEGMPVPEKVGNHTATMLTGVPVVGPAIVFANKKMSVKI